MRFARCPGQVATRGALRRRAGTQGRHGTAQMDGPRLGSASSNRTMLRIAGGTLRCVRGTREFSARTLLLVARSPCDEAIQIPAAERFWIASAFAKGFRGQVAALVMTECEATLRSPSNTVIPRLVRNRALERGIQYAAASRFNHWRLGVLDRPVKPGDDTECVTQTCVLGLAAASPELCFVSPPS